jgi:hypothetical protein
VNHRVELPLTDELLVVLDLFDFHDGKPFVSLVFYATGTKATMPSFNVGLPLDKWAAFQAIVAAYQPVTEATKQ